ncbi:hypothetical protein KEM48_009741 [Puccinia striiformis f. sp. tritici PST-130]|nr:hypothetical protein KEM48_009741 [Puccinia striiformis f. sp. tritici PST-130]
MAMDGEEGCSVARLDGFIESYYARRRTRYPAEPGQFVDESYKNFVWRKLCQLEPVRLGVLEPAAIPNEAVEDDPAGDLNLNTSVQSSNETPAAETLQLPIIASKAANKMTQRPNRLTKSTKNRAKSEVLSSSRNTDANSPVLSIGQLRALKTGKVQKNFQVPQAEEVKKATATSKQAAAPSSSAWKELSPTLVTLPRDQLIAKFGLDEDGESKLKIAVDPMSCWKAVVGTDTRSPRLTPYVYQVLSIVAQGREAGATVIELGRKLKHDQKSLFHFVKVLIDLQLVVKFRAYQHKAWTNRVVHRRYLATSEWYQNSIRKDEDHQTSTTPQTLGFELDECSFAGIEQPETSAMTSNSAEPLTMDNIINSLATDDQPKAGMSPMNREFLAVNENLVKLRMFTVLKRSPDNTMVHADIIKAIVLSQFPVFCIYLSNLCPSRIADSPNLVILKGIATPTKDERRRLNRLIDAYIKRGLLERVAIVNLSGHTPARGGTKRITYDEVNRTKVHDLLENAGQEGIVYKVIHSLFVILCCDQPDIFATQQTLCHKLNDLEARTAEQILTRMEREQAPSHLSHVKISSVLETSGREKRVRWFSAQGLKAKCQASGIMLATEDENERESNMGGFIDINPSTLNQDFYENATQLYGQTVSEPKGSWGKQVTKKASRVSKQAGGMQGNSLQEKDMEKDYVPEIPLENVPNSLNDSGPTKRVMSERTTSRKRTKLALDPGPPTISAKPSLPEAPNEHPELPTELCCQPSASTLSQHSNQPLPGNSPPPTTGVNEPDASIIPPADTLSSSLKARGTRQNLTTLHREYHLLEAIKFAGGIVEKTNELAKAVRDLVDRADQDQYPARGPEMRKWLDDMKVRFKTLDKATEARVNQHKDFASPVHRLPPRSGNNPSPLPNALGVNDEALHAAFMNQWRCLSQLYGFILELPVGVFAKLVPIMAKSEEFETLRASPGAMETPMSNTPLAIRRLFQIGNQFSRVKVYQIVEVLYHLKLIVPLQKSPDVSEYYRIADSGEKFYYSPTQMCTSVGLFCLANAGHVYGFSERSQNPPPVLAKWPLKDEHDGERYWEELKRACIPDPEAPPIKNAVDSVENEKLFNGPPKILQMLTDQSKWRDGIQLTPTQREYVARFDRQTSLTHDLEADDEMISNIAHVLVTVPEAVRQAIRTSREAAALARAKKAQKALGSAAQEKDEKTGA